LNPRGIFFRMEGVVSRRPAHAENSRCAALALPIPYGPSPSFLVYEPQQLTPVHQFFRALLLRRLYDHFDQTSDESCRSHLSSVWHELRGPTLQVQVFSKERKAPRLCNRESRPRGTWPVKSSPALERNHSLIYPMLFASVEDRAWPHGHQPFARAGPMVGCEWWQHTQCNTNVLSRKKM